MNLNTSHYFIFISIQLILFWGLRKGNEKWEYEGDLFGIGWGWGGLKVFLGLLQSNQNKGSAWNFMKTNHNVINSILKLRITTLFIISKVPVFSPNRNPELKV